MEREQRRLAAIMFTDMVGYSALAGRDEALALRLVDIQLAILRPLLSAHGGREVRTMADGLLAEFDSAVSAAQCALEVQSQIAARNAAQDGQDLLLRIGLHIGDVVIRDGDVLGDGVNIASRIEPLAEPGGICVTEDFARQIKQKVPAELVSIGRPKLKNIETGMEVFRLKSGASSTSRRTAVSRSVAALPFVNMSSDPENEFFSDGLTEDIITQLSKIRDLKVISRTSVMQYKNARKNLRDVAQELGVATVLEGSVRKAGSRVRIAAQLIDAETDEHLWVETYDRELSDIFEVQSDVAEKIARALEANITTAEEGQIRRAPTQSTQAYQLYLRGRFLWNRRTADSLESAIQSFQEAIAIDPDYAEAYAGIADAYVQLAILEFRPPREAFPAARQAAERALSIDPKLPAAHASLGLLYFLFDWDWAAAEGELRLATELNPNYAPGHHFFADYLKGMGRFDEAFGEIKRAHELDPLSLAINSGVGHVLYLSRQYDRAIEAYRRTVELDPNYLQARLWFGRPYLQKGMFSEAITELRQAVKLSGDSTMSLAVLAHALASAGEKVEALRLLETLKARSQERYVPSYWLALVYVGLGVRDSAFELLDRAYEERSSWLPWINVEPRFDCLRADPRYRVLTRRIGFPEQP